MYDVDLAVVTFAYIPCDFSAIV